MPRAKGGYKSSRRRNRIRKHAKGFRGGYGKLYRSAIEFTNRAKKFATRDRAQRKRHFRSLWVTRLAAAVRERGIAYNRFIPALIAAGIELNRKMLSELASADPAAFDKTVELAKPHLKNGTEKAAA